MARGPNLAGRICSPSWISVCHLVSHQPAVEGHGTVRRWIRSRTFTDASVCQFRFALAVVWIRCSRSYA